MLLLPVTSVPVRAVMPAVNTWFPTTRQLDQVCGGGSETWGLLMRCFVGIDFSLFIIIAWWTSEATTLTFEQGSKMDRGTILQIGTNRLEPNGQASTRQSDRKRRRWLAAERG